MANGENPTVDQRFGRYLTPEQVAPSYTVPSFSADVFVVQPVRAGTRIAFGENAPNTETTHYRFAVTLSNHDAVQLYRVLKDVLKPYEDSMAAAVMNDPGMPEGG